MVYQVKLEVFEGPLDLLLYLIKKQQIDIYDIPIAHITAQYLEYLQLMEKLNLEIACEFIIIAATLIRIKSKMLLPRDVLPEDIEEEDPRQELVNQLIEYQKFKKVAEELNILEKHQRDIYVRGYQPKDENDTFVPLSGVTLFDLLTAVKSVMLRIDEEHFEPVPVEPIKVDEKIRCILDSLKMKSIMSFHEFFTNTTARFEIIVTFIALLELIRLRKVIVKQNKLFGEIWVYSIE